MHCFFLYLENSRGRVQNLEDLPLKTRVLQFCSRKDRKTVSWRQSVGLQMMVVVQDKADILTNFTVPTRGLECCLEPLCTVYRSQRDSTTSEHLVVGCLSNSSLRAMVGSQETAWGRRTNGTCLSFQISVSFADNPFNKYHSELPSWFRTGNTLEPPHIRQEDGDPRKQNLSTRTQFKYQRKVHVQQ